MNKTFPSDADPIKLYRVLKSGHSHRAQLMMALLDLPYETIDVDMGAGDHRKPDYLAMSPFGQVPVIDDNGVVLTDSNGIITYLAERYGESAQWTGADPVEKAQVQRWLSIAAGEIFAGPCCARLVTVFGAGFDHDACIAKSHALFEVMEQHLEGKDFLVAGRLTLADVAGYTYIAHAPEGGVSLESYPAIRHWLANIEAAPGFVGMAKSAIPELT